MCINKKISLYSLQQVSDPTEVWKPIGIEILCERYSVSSHGRCYDHETLQLVNIHDNGNGYKFFPLRKNKSQKNVYVHRAVAFTFLENPENKPTVNHKDYDKTHNHLVNLEWVTHSDQTKDGVSKGKINAKKRPNTKKLSKAQICEIALLSHQGKGVNEIAIMLDFPRTTISSVFNGRSNWELFEFAMKEVQQTP